MKLYKPNTFFFFFGDVYATSFRRLVVEFYIGSVHDVQRKLCIEVLYIQNNPKRFKQL